MPKPYTSNFNAERMAQIYIDVLRLLQLKRMSRNPKVSARDIAKQIGCDHRAISAAISTQAGLNFHQLIGKIRSNEVAQRLVDPKFSDYTAAFLAVITLGFWLWLLGTGGTLRGRSHSA